MFLLLTAGAGGWMQTQDAFQRLWLPLTAQLLGGTWSAEQGRLGLDGTFEADGLRFVAPDLGQGVVERVQLKLRPWASLWRGAAVIEQIQVAGADLNLREAADAADAGPDTRSSDRGPFSFNWPVIEQARVDDTWIRTEAGAYALVLGPLTARIEGSEGRKLSVEVPVELLAEGDELRGRLTSALEFSSGESDTDQGTFDGNLDLALDSQTRSPIVLKLHGEGRTAGERVELTGVEVDWRVAGSPVLELSGSGTLSPEPMLDAHLVMAEAGLVASLLGESSLEARIEGDVHVEGSFDELVIEPALVVGELRATPDASTPLSEPLQVKGRMTWLRRKQALLLEPLELAGGSAEGLGALSLEGT
ncbi:MAG: hypothetical protein GY946_14475, partial [bacterium]|nr:hypothetical protein [bacterium]